MSVFYTNVARDGNDLLVRFADHQGGRKQTRIKKFAPTFYLPTHDYSNVAKIGLHGEALTEKVFDSIRAAENYMEEYKDVEGAAIYGQTNYAFQFIAHKFGGNIEPDYENIHIANVDIEVFSGGWDAVDEKLIKGPFPEPVVSETSKPARNVALLKRYIKKAQASQEFIKAHFPNSFTREYNYDPEDHNTPGNIRVDFDPQVLNAAFPIPLIQLQDMAENKYHIFGMPCMKDRMKFKYNPEDTEIGGLDVVYHEYETEQDLLKGFLDHWEGKKYDGWTGWNIEQFDCPYLVERIKLVLGDVAVNRLSPWGIVRHRYIKNAKGDIKTYDFVGCELLDYKEIYQKHTYTTRERYSLDWIAYCELGEKKMDYAEAKSLNTLFFTNYDKYCRYGIKDTKLVYRIDQKLKLLQLMFVLAYKTKSNYRDGLGTVAPWLALCYYKLFEKGIVPQIKRVYQGPTNFEGAFVLEVKKGRHRWLISLDLNSLYPHIIQQYNLGPETIIDDKHLRREIIEAMIKQLEGSSKEMSNTMSQRARYKALAEKLRQAIPDDMENRVHVVDELIAIGKYEFTALKEHNVSFTPNVQFFRNDKMSFLSEIMRWIYSQRKIEKATGLRYEQYEGWCKELEAGTFSLENAKKSRYWDQAWYDETMKLAAPLLKEAASELEKQAIIQDVLQQGLKILMNAGYGATGNVWFKEYFDLRISEGITLSGQLVNKWNKKHTDAFLNKEFGTAGVEYVVAGDTDSNYIVLEKLVQREMAGVTDIHKIADYVDDWVKGTYSPMVNQWCEDLCSTVNGFEQRMVWEREVIAPEAIWRAKKMYCMAVIDSEGVRYNKPEIKFKGLEARKSSTPEWCRNKLKECYEIALLGTEADVQKFIAATREEYMKLPIEDIAKASSVSDLEKWMEGNSYRKGTHFAAKAAINYNKMIEAKAELELEPIESGDKVLLVNLKPNNPVGEDYLAFPDYLDPELDMARWVDYNVSFEKGFIDPIQSILEVVGWNWKRRVNLMAMMGKK